MWPIPIRRRTKSHISAPGFSNQVRSGITLTVGAVQVLNIALQVGAVTQTVEVTTEAPTVQLSSSAITAEVNEATVQELPLNGRDWTSLATLQPGVTGLGSVQEAFTGNNRVKLRLRDAINDCRFPTVSKQFSHRRDYRKRLPQYRSRKCSRLGCWCGCDPGILSYFHEYPRGSMGGPPAASSTR